MYLVTVAGSAGSIETLGVLLGGLPRRFPAALAIALHTGPGSALVSCLRSRSALEIRWAISGQTLCAGHVYVAPPREHLIINPDARVTVSSAPSIRAFRPSADWLFESAAASFRNRHVAIVLGGMLSDGSVTLRAVRRSGGMVFVQTPSDCQYPDMPRAAIATGQVDRVLATSDMPAILSRMFSRRQTEVDTRAWDSPFDEPGA